MEVKPCKYMHGDEKHFHLSEDCSLNYCKEKKVCYKERKKKPGKLVTNLFSICIPIYVLLSNSLVQGRHFQSCPRE